MVSIVADTNILVSSLIAKGNEHKLMELVHLGLLELISSKEMLEELSRVLGYEKLHIHLKDQQEFFERIKNRAVIVNPTIKVNIIKDDDTDDKVVEAALAGQADYIITGDNHLLKIKEFRSIKIIRAGDLLNILKVF